MKIFSISNIKKIDKQNMLEILLDFPQQCKVAIQIAKNLEVFSLKKDFNKIVFIGMGGSAIAGDLIRSYLYSEIRIPILVLREYDVAGFLDKESLVFACSYSGNTEETISFYQQAKEKFSTIIGISSGGRLKELCFQDKNLFIEIPKGLPPRCALGYLGLIPLKILEKLGLITDREEHYKELILILEGLKRRLSPTTPKLQNPAKYIASKLYNKLPIIYSSSLHFDVVVNRFRTQLNENAKILAWSNTFPELNHNEIEGFSFNNLKRLFKNLVVIFLNDKGMHPQVKKRISITSDIIKDIGIDILGVSSEGNFLLTRIFSLIYILDFASFYLALLYKTDPTPVERIGYLKQRLKE
ncbi:MAG: bifunctional phosphoglucose/phosphomannose isomerase [Candidatus Omnitrophica bacterium]|nr:bifunctional phosphoglucose/phosphomannose isomerase [Candidatus Omnitrophota bacterium]